MKYILLEIFVDESRPELFEMYRDHIEKHNAENENNPYPNSGFDLFIPNNIEFNQPYQTQMVDLLIKAQMWDFIYEPSGPTVMSNQPEKSSQVTQDSHPPPVNQHHPRQVTQSDQSTQVTQSDQSTQINQPIQPTQAEYFSTGYYLYPRSSLAKTQLMMANHVGIIDAGYRNNLLCAFRYLPLPNKKIGYSIEAGTRLVQICHPSLLPIYVHLLTNKDALTTTTRTGGFGSTGGTV